MKHAKILLAGILSLSMLLAGCGKAPAVEATEAPTEAPQASPLAAYQALLEAAPALQGHPEELDDAAFGAEENHAKFGDHIEQFALYDLNNDGTPELIVSSVVNFRWVPISVYTLVDGKAVLIADPLGESTQATFQHNASANGAFTLSICEDHHLHSIWQGSTPAGEMQEEAAYALTGTTLTAVNCANTGTLFEALAVANTAENIAAAFQNK